MTKAHNLKARKTEALAPQTVPMNFLLGCSDLALGNFELGKLSMVANLRAELHAIFDRLIDEMSQAGIAAWFRTIDRNDLRQVLEHPEDVLEWAKGQIRHRKEADELIPLPSLPAGAAHLAAAIRYQERNLAEGKCAVCPEPLDRNSVRYCARHLAEARNRARTKKGLTSDPGSVDFLYAGDIPESTHGRQPGTLKSLAMNREQRTREILAEAGFPPESAAITKRAAKEALMERMSTSKDEAKSSSELFLGLPASDSLAKKALADLLSEGKVKRVGKGVCADSYRYFATHDDLRDAKRKLAEGQAIENAGRHLRGLRR